MPGRPDRAIDVFYCTNAVNYTIAMEGVLPGRTRRAIVLYGGRRLSPRARPGVWQWRVSYFAFLALRLLGRAWPLGTLFMPHHRLPSALRRLAPRMQGQAFIDDGLDTLRRQPANVDLSRLVAGTEYFTFREYRELPDWLASLSVRRVCRLADMATLSAKPAFDLSAVDHVFFESPGLDPQGLIQALQLPPGRVLVVRHPVVAKQGPLPDGCAVVPGNQGNPEATLLAAQGKHFYFGETMAAVFALLCGPAERNTLWLQLRPAQWSNLCGLPALADVPLPGPANPLRVSRPRGRDNAGHEPT